MSMDDDFEAKQARRAHARAHGSAKDSLGGAADSLADGFTDGFSGIFLKPIEGAEEDGVGGFFKGLGGGLAGAVTKPVAGVFGAVAGVTGAVKAGLGLNHFMKPVRLRRAIPNEVVTVYDHDGALAQYLLHHLMQRPDEIIQGIVIPSL